MTFGTLVGLFAAGLLTFASPCVLPMLPVYVSVLGGAAASADPERARRRLRLAGLGFALGLASVFVALGIAASALASTVSEYRRAMLIGAGVLMILFGAKLLGLLRIGILDREARPLLARGSSAGGFAGGVAFGAAFGLGWTPCVGPVLGAALTYSASAGANVVTASVQLGAYALGLALPLVVAAFAAERVLAWSQRLRGATPILQKVTGALLVAAGALLATDHLDAVVPSTREATTATTAEAPCEAAEGVCVAPTASRVDTPTTPTIPTGASHVIEFASDHCPACARMAPVMAELERACASISGAVVRISLDDADGRELAARYGVRVMPTFVAVDAGGKEVERLVGEHPAARLAAAIENVRGETCLGL